MFWRERLGGGWADFDEVPFNYDEFKGDESDQNDPDLEHLLD